MYKSYALVLTQNIFLPNLGWKGPLLAIQRKHVTAVSPYGRIDLHILYKIATKLMQNNKDLKLKANKEHNYFFSDSPLNNQTVNIKLHLTTCYYNFGCMHITFRYFYSLLGLFLCMFLFVSVCLCTPVWASIGCWSICSRDRRLFLCVCCFLSLAQGLQIEISW